MKTRFGFLCVPAIIGVMLNSPASAGNISSSNICAGSAYCNGEVNGNIDGWTINFGFAVSDSFTLASNGTVTSVSYGVRNFPGDSGGSIDWTILTGGPDMSAGGTIVSTGHVSSLATRDLGLNQFGFDIQVDSFSLSQALQAGTTYFLELQNASVPSGDPVYWDENDGPLGNGAGSIAWDSGVGFLVNGAGDACTVPSGYCSESFAIYTNGPVPEPGTVGLGASGLLLLACALRLRRIH